MKASGIIRRIDDLGRLIVPREIRRILSIREGDLFEIFYENDAVIFRRYHACNNHKEALVRLRANIREDDELNNRSVLLSKIDELDALLTQAAQ